MAYKLKKHTRAILRSSRMAKSLDAATRKRIASKFRTHLRGFIKHRHILEGGGYGYGSHLQK